MHDFYYAPGPAVPWENPGESRWRAIEATQLQRDGYCMVELMPAAAIVLLASVLQACTGFGFSILATPFLLLVYDAREAIQINIILSILISLWLVPRLASTVDKRRFRRLVIGSAIGSVAGIALYVYADAGDKGSSSSLPSPRRRL